MSDRDEVLRLALVIQFLLNAETELLKDAGEPIALAGLGVRVEPLCDLLQDLEVLRDLLAVRKYIALAGGVL